MFNYYIMPYYAHNSELLTIRFVLFLTHLFIDDILAIVLALYMHDKKQLLPSCEEVLLCTPDTTTEEVQCTCWENIVSIFIYFFLQLIVKKAFLECRCLEYHF